MNIFFVLFLKCFLLFFFVLCSCKFPVSCVVIVCIYEDFYNPLTGCTEATSDKEQ